MMGYISFHINRTERTGGAKMLTRAAADAFVFIHGGNFHSAVRAFIINHLDGSRRAMAGAIAATDAIAQHYAILLDPHGMTGMDGGLFLTGNGLDGTSGANLAAPCTFRPTIAALK